VGWHEPYVYIIFIVGILLTIPFIFIEAKVSHPAMPLDTWRNPIVAAMMICLTMVFIGFGIFLLFITLLYVRKRKKKKGTLQRRIIQRYHFLLGDRDSVFTG
jgi:multisubunit Na+/H+ antiporter MnhC subunit